LSKEVNISRSEEIISTAGKEDTPKPQSMEKINASVSKDNILVVSIKETLKQRADEKIRASEVLSERTCSSISKTEATLPCVQTQNNITSPHEAHKGSRNAEDSEDIVESSQDSNLSLLTAARLPLMQKCSVSLRRIKTILGPGDVTYASDGGSMYMVLTPEGSGSPLEVSEDKSASTNYMSSLKENSQECRSKQDINKLALENTQLTAVRENASKCIQ
jgi:hypothetical protein